MCGRRRFSSCSQSPPIHHGLVFTLPPVVPAGIRAVICGSVSETYKRNALNNGLLVLEVPGLVRALQARFPDTLTAQAE